MAKIKFETGQVVNFEGTPTPADIEEVAAKLGISKSVNPPAPKDTRDLLQKTGDVVNSIFPGKQLGESIGTLGGYGLTAAGEKLGMMPKGSTEAYDTSAPSVKSTVGDAAMAALTVGSLGGRTLGTGGALLADALKSTKLAPVAEFTGKSLQSAIQGAWFGGAGAMKEDKNLSDISRNIGGTALVSSLFPAAGVATNKLVGSLVDNLPRSMTRNLLGQTKNALKGGKEVSDHFLEEGRWGTYKSLSENSRKMMSTMNDQVKESLNSPGFKDKLVNRNSWLDSMVTQINEKGGKITRKELLATLQSDIPGGAGLLSQQKITLPQLDKLRRRIGDSINDSAWLANKSTFSKQTLKNAYWTVSEAVKSNGPKNIRPLFDDLTKEHLISDALAGKLADKTRYSLKEIMGAIGLGTLSTGGISGAAIIPSALSLGGIKSATVKSLVSQGLYQGGKQLKSLAPTIRNVGATVGRTLSSQ